MLRHATLFLVLVTSCKTFDGPEGVAAGQKAAKSDVEPKIANLYAYEDPADPETFANVFVMGGRRMIAICLVAESRDGLYAGDKVGIYEVTRGAKLRGWSYDLQTPTNGSTVGLQVSVRPSSDDTIVTISDDGGSVARVSVNALYRWRVSSATKAASIGDEAVRYRSQGGATGGFVYFPASMSTLVLDPEITRAQLCPKFVIITVERDKDENRRRANEFPFGATGYVLRWNEDEGLFLIELATSRKQ